MGVFKLVQARSDSIVHKTYSDSLMLLRWLVSNNASRLISALGAIWGGVPLESYRTKMGNVFVVLEHILLQQRLRTGSLTSPTCTVRCGLRRLAPWELVKLSR